MFLCYTLREKYRKLALTDNQCPGHPVDGPGLAVWGHRPVSKTEENAL